MYLNRFADTTEPLDMTETEEFRLLLASAADLGISHAPEVPYRSCNIVLRQMRFHFLEWGAPDAPPIVLLHGGHQSAHSWDLVSLHLAQRYRVLALDQRGHGDSEWARDVVLRQSRDVAGRRGVHRRAWVGAADPDGPLDGRAQRDAADPAQPVAAARAGDRRCGAGGIGSRARR